MKLQSAETPHQEAQYCASSTLNRKLAFFGGLCGIGSSRQPLGRWAEMAILIGLLAPSLLLDTQWTQALSVLVCFCAAEHYCKETGCMPRLLC